MITINIDKAKVIGHNIRRSARAAEFAPLDEAIAKRIPDVDYVEAEEKRQVIREKYAAIQAQIDAATTPDQIKSSLGIA
jgi:hypothetical protein